MTVAACLQRLLSLPDSNYQLRPPASKEALSELALAVGILPTELHELYRLSNGIAEYFAVGQQAELTGYLVLPAEAAIKENRRVRNQPQTPLEADLLIVSPTYTGGWFGYRRADLPPASAAIYAWLPIEDECIRVADSLPEFLLGWASGHIQI